MVSAFAPPLHHTGAGWQATDHPTPKGRQRYSV